MPGAPVNPTPVDFGSYPQWGIHINPDGTSGSIREAASAAQKMKDMGAGYLDWFATDALAKNALSSQTSAYGSGGQSTAQAIKNANPLSGLAAIGDFFSRLTQPATWIRIAEVALGLVLIAVGIARATGSQNQLSQLVRARLP